MSSEEAEGQLDRLPGREVVEETAENLEERGFNVEVVEDGDEALEVVKDLLPDDAEVNWGSSTTLKEIGFEEYVKDAEVKNLKDEIWSIDDDEKRADARRKSVTADYFFGSVNGVAKTGEMVAADKSGSRVGAYPFAAKNLVLVSGINKITDDLESARERLWDYVYPRENERAKEEYGVESQVAKEFIFRHETIEDRTTVILIHDRLGF